jgi:ABC-2 type transport system permease protein
MATRKGFDVSVALRGSIGSEWIKLWSVRSTWWALTSALFLMSGCSAIMGMDFAHDVEAGETKDGLTMAIGEPATSSTMLAQFAIVALAMAVMTAEFTSGAIRGTLTADPNRGRVLFAKTAVVVAVTGPLSLVLAGCGVGMGRLSLGSHGITTSGEVAGDVAAIVAYLVLTAILTVGAGAVLRSPVSTLSAVLTVMLALPMVVQAGAADYLPGHAGLNLLDGDAFAAAILAAWALAAQYAGWTALRRRDI